MLIVLRVRNHVLALQEVAFYNADSRSDRDTDLGEVAEWSNVPDSKSGVR